MHRDQLSPANAIGRHVTLLASSVIQPMSVGHKQHLLITIAKRKVDAIRASVSRIRGCQCVPSLRLIKVVRGDSLGRFRLRYLHSRLGPPMPTPPW